MLSRRGFLNKIPLVGCKFQLSLLREEEKKTKHRSQEIFFQCLLRPRSKLTNVIALIPLGTELMRIRKAKKTNHQDLNERILIVSIKKQGEKYQGEILIIKLSLLIIHFFFFFFSVDIRTILRLPNRHENLSKTNCHP